MKNGNYPSSIFGFRFLERRELAPVSTCWEFQTTSDFSREAARKLFISLPEDCDVSYFDPAETKEEAYLKVRRIGQRFFVNQCRRRVSPRDWQETPLDSILNSFMSEKLVREPTRSLPSFSVYSIPDHQRGWHKPRFWQKIKRLLTGPFSS
jgi:hypothetical protein